MPVPSRVPTLTAFGEIAVHVSLPWRDSNPASDTIELAPVVLAVGGGTSIVCQQLRALQHRVRMVAMVAADGYGESVLGQLRDCGVELLPPLIGGTRTTVAVLESRDDGQHHITYSPSDADAAGFVERAAAVGSSAFAYSPGFPGFEPLLEQLAKSPATLVADLGYRPWLADAATYRREVLERAGLVDCAALSGAGLADDELDRLLHEVIQAGASAVVATRGALGAVVHDGTELRAVPGFVCRARHTVGAGDAFVAGLIAGLAEGRGLADAATLGNAAAAGRISAFPRVPGRQEIDALASASQNSGNPAPT
jgi:sugar/nucleoside kinase (ribokinase family)